LFSCNFCAGFIANFYNISLSSKEEASMNMDGQKITMEKRMQKLEKLE